MSGRARPGLLLLFPPALVLVLASTGLREGVSSGPTTPTPSVQAAPTFDRLAQPTLPAAPGQADIGARVYWGYCLPCHGDRGQGLTDEFRKTYPPEEEYCWKRGCHGARPYDQGFILPTAVPAVIGPNALRKFPTAARVQGYIGAAMPFWNPGMLSPEETWQVTAFLLRENGLLSGDRVLDGTNASAIQVGGQSAQSTPTAGSVSPTESPGAAKSSAAAFVGAGALVGVAILLAIRAVRQARKSARH